jgi:multicomponent Na+:H+ antiporter subunit G
MLNIVIVTLMSFGLFFFFGTVVGLIRFPDFYTRMHAAGKGDTLSSALLLTGLALYHLHHLNYDTILVSVKIMFIVLFVFIASPTATHAIMDAGYETNAKPWVKKQKGPDEHPEKGKML